MVRGDDMLTLVNSLWLGILTSISPCPLANNIAAVGYLSKNVANPQRAVFLGFIYTLGRMFFYMTLGLLLSFGIEKIGITSLFLQKKMNIILGLVLVIIGLIILDVIKLKTIHGFSCGGLVEKCRNCTYGGTFLLGALFASAFCPVSAGLFFGNLIQNRGNPLSFLAYGLGTGLPVLLASFLLAFGANKIGTFYRRVGVFERYSTRIAGIIFIATGVYLLFNYLGF